LPPELKKRTPVLSVTFTNPALKPRLDQAARKAGMPISRFVVEAIEEKMARRK